MRTAMWKRGRISARLYWCRNHVAEALRQVAENEGFSRAIPIDCPEGTTLRELTDDCLEPHSTIDCAWSFRKRTCPPRAAGAQVPYLNEDLNGVNVPAFC